MMNKKIYKYFKKEISKNRASFDTWGSDEAAFLYNFFKNKKTIIINEELFVIYHYEGGGCGMGQYPSKVKVEQIDINNIENIKVEDI